MTKQAFSCSKIPGSARAKNRGGSSNIAFSILPIIVELNSNSTSPVDFFGVRIKYSGEVTNVSVDGTAYASGTALPADTAASFSRTVTYTYFGNNLQFILSKNANSNTLNGFTVTSASPSTSLTLTSSKNPSLMSEPVMLTATLAPSSATGTVTFTDTTTSTALCTAVPLSSGVASCNASFATAGAHAVSAVFTPAGAFTPSTGALIQTVNDQRGQTVAAIGRFLDARNNQILSNGPDAGRQIDRLIEAGGDSAGGTSGASATGFATVRPGMASSGLGSGLSSRLGYGPDAGDVSSLRFGGRDRSLADTFRGATPYNGNPYPGPGGGFGMGGFGSSGDPGDMAGPGTSPRGFGGGGPAYRTDGGGGGVTMNGMRIHGNVDGAMRFGFAASLRDMTRAAAEADARKATAAGMSFAGAQVMGKTARPNPFDIWVEGKYSSFSDGRSASALDGHFGLFSIGADYVLSRSLLVGTMVQFDGMQQRSNLQQTDVRGHGWMAGPYATLRLSENVFLQARGAWGTSSNWVSPFQTYTDNFESERWLVSSTLTGRWTNGAWSYRPSASVSYMEDVSKSYADTYGIVIPSVKSTLGQAKAGPEVSYRFDLGHTQIEPRAGMQAIWNFSRETTAVGFGQVNGEAIGPAGVRGRAELVCGQRLLVASCWM